MLMGGEGALKASSFVRRTVISCYAKLCCDTGILEGLSTLHESGVRPRWVVIDDGWQHTTNDDALNSEQWDERLVGLEANKRFRHVHRFQSARGHRRVPVAESSR